MLTRVAFKTIVHEKLKYAGAIGGVALALTLVLLQSGFFLGFRQDMVVTINRIDADIWITPKGLASVDYPIMMDDLPHWRVLGNPQVRGASRIIYSSQYWRNPVTGGRDPVKVLGIDLSSGIDANFGVDWRRLRSLLKGPGRVAVNIRSLKRLGIDGIRQEGLEISGRRAEVTTFIRGIHLATALDLIVTDLESAREFSRMPSGHCDFVAVKCVPGADAKQVAREIAVTLPPHYDVLTTDEMRAITQFYWTSKTGIGSILLFSTALGGIVGLLLVLNTIYVNTLESVPLFAAMKAMGASTAEIVRLLFIQIGTIFFLGTLLSLCLMAVALYVLSFTKISVFIPPMLPLFTLAVTAAISFFACLPSVRIISRTEPAEAFRS
jgi:putative ABC transport system permease protein